MWNFLQIKSGGIMSMSIFAFLFAMVLADAVQAESVQRFVGTHTVHRKWTGDEVYKCYASVKFVATGYEVMITYGSRDFEALENKTFIFAKKDFTNPATDSSYDEVPVNFSNNQYFAYSKLSRIGTLRMSFKKSDVGMEVDSGWGFQFLKESDRLSSNSAHCLGLRKLNNY